MEHEILAIGDGQLGHVYFATGETVEQGQALFTWSLTVIEESVASTLPEAINR
jgi:hypothetical protein